MIGSTSCTLQESVNMNNINCLFLLLIVQYYLWHLLVAINCVTCSILASTGSGWDVWRYVAIILTLIGVVAGIAGIYFFCQFYPILCKKKREYDELELPPVWRYVSARCICGCHLFSVMGKIEYLCFQAALLVTHYRNSCTFFLFNLLSCGRKYIKCWTIQLQYLWCHISKY